jgi:hypothetical protein
MSVQNPAKIRNHDQEGTEFHGDSGSSRMSNEEPNLEGWTLYETLQRVGDVLRPAVESRLIAFGRLGSPHANFSFFPLAKLGGQFCFSQTPAVDQAEAVCAGKDVFDLRFFPVLKAPNVEDILRDVPLKTAFDLYVTGDPEVERLGAMAVSDYARLADIYLPGEGQLRYWPFNSDSLLEIGELEDHGEYFDYHPTARTHAAALALRDRLGALISLLRRRIYCVEGDPFRAGDPRVIPESNWLNPALWFDLKTGDVVQERDWSEDEVDYHRFEDGRENYTVRWRATMLIRTGQRSQHARSIHAVTTADWTKPKRIETKTSSAKECEAWLAAEMTANPKEPKQSRTEWLKEAQRRWPDLSERVFDRLWAGSIQKTGASAWSAPGRRKRSK